MTTSTPPQPDTADRLKNSTTSVDVNLKFLQRPSSELKEAGAEGLSFRIVEPQCRPALQIRRHLAHRTHGDSAELRFRIHFPPAASLQTMGSAQLNSNPAPT